MAGSGGSKLLIPEPALQVLPSLAEVLGVNEAIVLQQIHFWSLGKLQRGESPWVYNTQEDWVEQFPWLSLRTFQRVVTSLKEKGVLLTQQPEGTNRRTHYLVKYDNLPGFDTAKMAASSRHFGGFLIEEQRQRKDQPSVSSLPTSESEGASEESKTSSSPSPVRSQLATEVEQVWSCYVAVMKPRGRGRDLGADDRRIVRDALKAADVEEIETAIRECEASDWHMKRGPHKNRQGGKYKSIGQILKPRPRKGETQRSRIEWWLDRAEERRETGTATFDVNAEADRVRREQGLA